MFLPPVAISGQTGQKSPQFKPLSGPLRQNPMPPHLIPDTRRAEVVWIRPRIFGFWKRFLLSGNVSLIVDLLTQRCSQVSEFNGKLVKLFATGLQPVGYQQNHLTLDKSNRILAQAARSKHNTSGNSQQKTMAATAFRTTGRPR
jgi:hypothetical protein